MRSATLRRLGWCLMGLLFLCGTGHGVRAAVETEPRQSAEESQSDLDAAQRLAQQIDRELARRWAAEKVAPALPADDAEFLRRVYLDIAGKIPPVSVTRAFLADDSPGKRQAVVAELLESPVYIAHFTNVWRAAMLPEVDADFQIRFLRPGFEAWLRRKLTDNVSYADIVREILTTPLAPRTPAPASGPPPRNEPAPLAFYQAKQLKPENLAGGTARVFLGVRIECAQCHNHPFDNWKREQFWSFAAFFAGIERQDQTDESPLRVIRELLEKRELSIPGTSDVVRATFLDGSRPSEKAGAKTRQTLADWLTARDNPWFAKAAVNRLWAHFFGRGLVDPVDDFSPTNAPSHPELLDELARQFAAHDFDLKWLIRAITASQAYQLTGAVTHASQEDPRLFARMAVKGLTTEQLFDSLAQTTGYYDIQSIQNPVAIGDNSRRAEFLEMFANESDSPTERQTTILQALTLMNGQFISEATGLEKSATVSALINFPLLSTADRVEALYLAALCRKPRVSELERLVKYVDEGGPTKDPSRALCDVFWAMLNSSEFLFNH